MSKKIITIVGTGPSLDNVNWSEVPEPRIALNFATHHTPRCYMVAIVDSKTIKRFPGLYHDRLLITSEHIQMACPKRQVKLPNCIITFPGCTSAMSAAIKFILDKNYNHVHFVGCDGGSSRAKRLEQYYINRDPEREIKNNKLHHQLAFEELSHNKVTWSGINY